MVCAKCGGSWLTAGGGSSPKNRLKAKFDIALFHDALDSPLAQLAGQGEDGCGRVAQLSVLLLHPVEFARLTDGRSFVSPATDLLGIDVHELHLLGVNAVDASALSGTDPFPLGVADPSSAQVFVFDRRRGRAHF